MTHRVELSARAAGDVREAYAWIRMHGPADPDAWRAGLEAKLGSLEMFPEGCGLAAENEFVAIELRQTFYGGYRIVFTVRGVTVHVVTIRHGARLPLSRRDLDFDLS
ncbi:MAG: type II toxin-antitoxin system RelE/ParE family toxin [Planctomycetales bacterium]